MASDVGTGIGVVMLLGAAALSTFGIVDAARRPVEGWNRVGQSKGLWIVLLSVGIILDFVFLSGLIISVLYLVIARSKLTKVAGPASAGTGWGSTPQTPAAAPGSPVAGWYADPGGSGQQRYWDGRSWTAELRP